jgi:hypothetical protein
MRAMKKKAISLEDLRRQFEQRRLLLGQVGYISQGSVQDRTRRPSGAGYQWTRKVAGKTITVALTAQQFRAMKGPRQQNLWVNSSGSGSRPNV